MIDIPLQGQFGEILWLAENLLKDIKTGYFVDIGAGDPVALSNTYYFETIGWKGLCIEADPRNFQNLLNKRTCDCFFGVISNETGIKDFYLHPQLSDLSSITKIENAKSIKMTFLEFPTLFYIYNMKQIDLLSIDVEGSELEILQNMMSCDIFPTVIICEYNSSGIIKLDETRKFFTEHKYQILHETEANVIAKRI